MEYVRLDRCFYRTDDEYLTSYRVCDCDKTDLYVCADGKYKPTHQISVCRNYWIDKIRKYSKDYIFNKDAIAKATMEIMSECGIKHCNDYLSEPSFYRINRHNFDMGIGNGFCVEKVRYNTYRYVYYAYLTPHIGVVYKDTSRYVEHLLSSPFDYEKRKDMYTALGKFIEENDCLPKTKKEEYLRVFRNSRLTLNNEELDLAKTQLFIEITERLCKIKLKTEQEHQYHATRNHCLPSCSAQ